MKSVLNKKFVFLTIICLSCALKDDHRAVIIQPATIDNRLSAEWLDALVTRMSKSEIDSFSLLKRELTPDEEGWKKLFESRAGTWNKYRDSLSVPFEGILLNDTIQVLTGFLGVDDAFTYKSNTICFDLTAFAAVYGKASLPENENKADRIFSHEYTHLLHKGWVKKHNPVIKTFKDSVLWECLYEGLGMYRSLTKKWLPVNGVLPQITQETIKELYPQFVEKMMLVEQNTMLSALQRKEVRKNLSRGSVNKKWGATSVAIWLSLESNGNDKNLIHWINKGPEGVILLAKKHLNQENLDQFEKVLGK